MQDSSRETTDYIPSRKKQRIREDEITVYSETPFDIEDEADLLIFLSTQLCQKIKYDDRFRVSVGDLREKYENVDGLFYYEFIVGQAARRVIPVRREANYFLLENKQIAQRPFFVKTRDHEEYRGNLEKFFSVYPSVDCMVMRAAVHLTNSILRTDRCCRFLLNYCLPESTIGDILVELSDHKLQTIAGSNKNVVGYSYFDPIMVENVVLEENLIELIKKITSPEHTGYKRLVMFMAIKMLHEYTHCKSFVYGSDQDLFADGVLSPLGESESGWHLENLLLSGMLELECKSEGEISLRLLQSDQLPIVIGSPDVEKIRTNLCAGKSASVRRSATTTHGGHTAPVPDTPVTPIHSLLLTATVDQERQVAASARDEQENDSQSHLYRYKLKIKNTSEITVHLPAGEELPFSAIRVTGFQYRSSERKQLFPRYGKGKLFSYQTWHKVAVAPDESRAYSIDMADFFTNLDPKQTHEFNFEFKCSFFDPESNSQHRYSSNTVSLFALASIGQSDPLATITSRVNIHQAVKVQFCLKIENTCQDD